MKINIIVLTCVILSSCTPLRCVDTFSKSTCKSVFNGISSGFKKHNQRMAEYREAQDMEKFNETIDGDRTSRPRWR